METTIENNKLIAEFMGFENCIVRNSNGKKYDYNLPNNFELIKEVETTIESNWCEILDYQDSCMVEDLKFNSSWDWLMPVVEKIETLDFIGKVSIQYYTLFSGTGCYMIQIGRDSENNQYPNSFPIENREFINEGVSTKTKLDATYIAVVEFIKWYNVHKKSQ